MGYESFQDYLEKRTLDDIMEDYDEQRDEWITELWTENGFVKSFRHRNGRTFYCEQIDDYTVDEKIAKVLDGKTVEAQMAYYFVTESRRLYETAFSEITKEDLSEKAVSLSDYEGVVELLLKGKILVGATIRGNAGPEKLLPGKSVCICFASDREDSGTKDREDDICLLFDEK